LEKLSNNTSIFSPFRLPKRSGGQVGGDTKGVFSPFKGDLPAGEAGMPKAEWFFSSFEGDLSDGRTGMPKAMGLINFNLYTFIFYLVLSL